MTAGAALGSLGADDTAGFCVGCARTAAACGGRAGAAIFVGAWDALDADEGGEVCASVRTDAGPLEAFGSRGLRPALK